MVAVAISDVRRFLVPDVLSLPAIPLGLMASGRFGLASGTGATALADGGHVIAMLAGFGSFMGLRILYRTLRGRDGLGLGDVKLAAAAGAWTGPAGLLAVVFVAATSALLLVMVSEVVWRGRGGARLAAQTAIPFGAFLAPAIWVVFVYLAGPAAAGMRQP